MSRHIDIIRQPASIYVCTESPFLGRVKIGRTTQTPIRRHQAIQVGNPNLIEMVYVTEPIKHHKLYEQAIHHAYKNKRIRGEWFQLEEWELLELIDTIKEDEEILLDNSNPHAISKILEHASTCHDHNEPIEESTLTTVYKTIKSQQGKQRVILRYKDYDTLYVHKDNRKGYCVSLDNTKDNIIEIEGQQWFKTQREIKVKLSIV